MNLSIPAHKNDMAIAEAVTAYIKYTDAACADGIPECEAARLYELGEEHARALPELPSDTVIGIKEKLRWLQREENYNLGGLGPDYLNGKVLISLFDDIKRLV